MMSCPTLITGDRFLERLLGHIDCQSQVIGSYGYLALGQPGSLAAVLISGLLTVFVAFFGIRLLLGPAPVGRDLVFDVLKIGIVLTLAFSWPAFRTVIYDVALKGPAQIANVIQTASANDGDLGFAERLQRADDRMMELTAVGDGRNLGVLIDQETLGAGFAGAALEEDAAFGTGRLLYLSSVVGTLALLRLAAGLLLALTPIVAGFYLFSQSRGIFAGWLKGLAFTVVGSIGATIVLTVELAMLEPWLDDAINVRELGYAIPSAPTELLALTLSFAFVQLLMLWLLAKVTFYRGWLAVPQFPEVKESVFAPPRPNMPTPIASEVLILRAERISSSVENSMRREQSLVSQRLLQNTHTPSNTPLARQNQPQQPEHLGSSFRRSSTRASRAAQQRDRSI